MTQLSVALTPGDLARQTAEWLEDQVREAIATRGSCAFALSGGRTPEPVYRDLATAQNIDWRRVLVYFADERAVPPDHRESNYRMVNLSLLSRAPIPSHNVHRMEAERADLESAARDYDHLLPDQLDVLLLGMGADGHTASLFAGSAALDERHRLVLPVLGAKPPERRLTITPPVIEAARKVAVIATGPDKAPMVARAVQGPWNPKAVPAQLARQGAWFLDRAAASHLAAAKAGKRVSG